MTHNVYKVKNNNKDGGLVRYTNYKLIYRNVVKAGNNTLRSKTCCLTSMGDGDKRNVAFTAWS